MFGLGLGEWLVILFVASLVFGPKFIVKTFRSLWGSLTGFGTAFKEAADEQQSTVSVKRTPKALPSSREDDGDGED